MKKNVRPVRFLVVANVGDDADHSQQLRHHMVLRLGSALSERSRTDLIRAACEDARRVVADLLSPDADVHVWQTTEDAGQPDLFLSGLLAVRYGRMSRSQAESLNQRLLPQVTCKQQMKELRFLACATVSTWVDTSESGGADDSEESEEEPAESIFGCLKNVDVLDYDLSGDEPWIAADVWRTVSVELPMASDEQDLEPQLRYVVEQCVVRVEEDLLRMCDGEIDDVEAWLLNDAGEPLLFATGLQDVLSGKCSAEQADDLSRRLLDRRPWLQSFRSAA